MVKLGRIAGATFLTVSMTLTACAWEIPSPNFSEDHTRIPTIIAHRGGTADAPENTLTAIAAALANGSDALWLSVQLTNDGVPVLYRPAELSALTDITGTVASTAWNDLQSVNAGVTFAETDAAGQELFPFRTQPTPIPSLDQALTAIPTHVHIILDMKTTTVTETTNAVAAVLNQHTAWDRVRIYSTDATYHDEFARFPDAQLFESRHATRTRLIDIAFGQPCMPPHTNTPSVGFEYERSLTVTEKYTLGEDESTSAALLWSPTAMRCFRSGSPTKIVFFGINTENDLTHAICLGADEILVDSPKTMVPAREHLVETITNRHFSCVR